MPNPNLPEIYAIITEIISGPFLNYMLLFMTAIIFASWTFKLLIRLFNLPDHRPEPTTEYKPYTPKIETAKKIGYRVWRK